MKNFSLFALLAILAAALLFVGAGASCETCVDDDGTSPNSCAPRAWDAGADGGSRG